MRMPARLKSIVTLFLLMFSLAYLIFFFLLLQVEIPRLTREVEKIKRKIVQHSEGISDISPLSSYECLDCSNELQATKWINERASQRQSIAAVLQPLLSYSCQAGRGCRGSSVQAWLCNKYRSSTFTCKPCGHCEPVFEDNRLKYMETFDSCTLCHQTRFRHSESSSWLDMISLTCCKMKIVNGIQYSLGRTSLVDYSDTQQDCHCLYEQFDLPGSRFCFPEEIC